MKTFIAATTVALASVFSLGACAVTSGQSTVGQYVDDATITARVKAKFAEDKQVSAMRINVETLKGEVQLSGFASNQDEKARAGQIALNVPDVKNVRNNIVVRAATN
ncbi:transporter [Aquabacterium olei]|jgi:osmotically-inducible protein OsmY|uniref:Transporter n=1 Tax=Aquabacterium olei TaxID=1296669 RepID=A0A2U8FXY0_9BURK|nr:BON domain-containing protein [Aquabacterium olei]AWI55086.1 transporter [Aquabacterium olei]